MDERHWWIAAKIQESFHIGGYDNPTLLEDFMCQPDTLDIINQFLNPGGPCRLFFYCDKPDLSESISTRQLHITGSLGILREVDLEGVTILYFLRHVVDYEVDAAHMEKDVYCGELKGNTLGNLGALLSEIYMPLFRAQKDWGQCTSDNQIVFMHNLEKTLSNLGDPSTSNQTHKHVMLRLPENTVGSDFKQHRLAALDQSIISEYEILVTDWMSTIEQVLTDTSDERFMDPNAGPLSELDRWKRRQRLLTSITEQLKGKECKAVIGVLITAKSRHLKKWKLVDSSITDAMNDTKDKVRYLESLKRHLDQLYHGATPATILNTALPGLIQTVKQMESVSRYYARQGFLGLLFTKVTNQIVLACKEYIQQCTVSVDDEDQLWQKVQQETATAEPLSSSQQKHLQAQLDNRLKGKTNKKSGADPAGEATVQMRLKSCLSLQSYYRDAVRSLRDALGASYNLSHFTSVSSLTPGTAGSAAVRSKLGVNHSSNVSRGGRSGAQNSPTKKGSVLGDSEGHGVSVADEETIMAHLDSFCARIRQILDVMSTFTQYNKLIVSTAGLPRPRQDDLVCDQKPEHREPLPITPQPEIVTHPVTSMGGDGQLVVIVEDEAEEAAEQKSQDKDSQKEETISGDDKEESEKGDRDEQEKLTDESQDVVASGSGLTYEDVEMLKKYFVDVAAGEEGQTITGIVQEHLTRMGATMMENVTTKTMLDVESKDKERFEDMYTEFLMTSQELEKFLSAYLNAIFTRRMKTREALELMTRFSPVQHRHGVRLVVTEKFVEIFNWYESDLDEIHKLYEKHKEEPPMLRNAPPVAGAIQWSRQLLKRIEEPMKVFRENKAVAHLKDFSRIVKIYNRLATALVTFESLWFTHWKNSIEVARNGLKATLLVQNQENDDIIVNSDDRVLQLIQEARWLSRIGIQIPESAQQILQQEHRYKTYKDHLELCLMDLHEVMSSIPDPLRTLFTSHEETTRQAFQAGMTTLTWNSMNIDAFLHQIHTNLGHLRFLVSQVNDVLKTRVEDTIAKMRDMIFFDYKLAFSRSWPPGEFTQCIGQTVQQQSATLSDYIATIEGGIKQCAAMLTAKKSRSGLASRDKLGGADTHHRNSTVEEDKVVAGLLERYNDKIYEAILLATTRTLVTLAESSGCEGEVIRAASALSEAPSSTHKSLTGGGSSPRTRSSIASRATSAKSDLSREVSVLSMLSNMTWTTEKTDDITYLQFEVLVKFAIPNIILEPELTSIQSALNMLARNVMQVPKGMTWSGNDELGEKMLCRIENDQVVDEILVQIAAVVQDLQSVVKQHILHFSLYDFLWKDDMYGNYSDFMAHDPGNAVIKREVERLLKIEHKVLDIPEILPVGPVCLYTSPIRDALHGFSMAWKHQYASVLHDEAKRKLESAALYWTGVLQRLEQPVINLDQLNSTLQLLEELRDMENKIDAVYLPIEEMYANLRDFELRLNRGEVQQVEGLREAWTELLAKADQVRENLLQERRAAFEQELDKQVKSFVVEVIRFRNAFDAQGPAVPNIPPSEAVHRLTDFQQRYARYDAKRRTLDSVSKLFGIPCKPFPELNKTGEELELLGMLYGLFQKFITFDDIFRGTLWAEVDLEAATREVESYWDECLALPSKLKDWEAYNDMKNSIQCYRDLFSLLHKLASKEIRNRHWLQVMSVTGVTFQLEANVFKLSHLLDIGLIKHRIEIEEICRSASRELELEVKLRMTEDEWTEQVLNFEQYKKRGPIYLDKVSTERLLEQLEDAQALLAQMLTSRYVGPLREEAASWAEKLKEVGEVLESWLEVQDLWQYLEAVFSNPDAAKELPQEAKRFSRIDKGWTKMMKRAYDTRNVLQCCYGEEVPKGVVLRHIYQELEICFKSLMTYLDSKRRQFPRFFFVSDPILLAILSRPNDLESVRPHLRTVFSAIHDVRVEKQRVIDHDDGSDDGTQRLHTGTPRQSERGRTPTMPGNTPKIDKRLEQIHDKDKHSDGHSAVTSFKHRSLHTNNRLNLNPLLTQQHTSSVLPSELTTEDAATMEATSVISCEGESMTLHYRPVLEDGVESWLTKLKEAAAATLYEKLQLMVQDINNNMPCEEWAHKYPTQICRLGLLYHWTRECEQSIAELKYDRKAMHTCGKKYGAFIAKMSVVLGKGSWKTIDEAMLPAHKLRLESMITQALFLRDNIDSMASRKLRENTDFEWRRCLRFYIHMIGDKPAPCLYMLDQQFNYGCEFYGAQPMVGLTPVTDKCYLSMALAISQHKGAMVMGDTGVGKTETVKGFAQTMGEFIMIFHCTKQQDPMSLGRAIQGLALDGSWGCFDDIHRLGSDGLSILVDHIQAILGALKAKQTYCFIADGQEIAVKPKVAMFLTHNPSELPTHKLPCDLRALFRQVALVRPDPCLVLKAKCSSLQLKSPSVLATRLKIVAELARDQLPSTSHNTFSMTSLTAALQRAASSKRYIREDRHADKSEKNVDKSEKRGAEVQESRSNSVMSTATSNPGLLQQQSSSFIVSQGPQKTRKAGTPNPLSAGARIEHSIVGQCLLDIIGPRLSPEHSAVFRQIVRDVFSGLPEPPSSIGGVMSAHSRTYDVEAAVESTATELGLIPHKPWMDKCMQLYALSHVHQGIIVAGPPGSGKSRMIHTLVDALCVTPRAQSHGSSHSASNITQTSHKLQRIYPLVVDDLGLIFGRLDSNREWVDGIFTSAWRKATRNQSTTWLCLDGPLNGSWADNFSSVLDSNKMLSLANGDKLHLSANIKLLFETDNLQDASPAVVSKTGIVYLDKIVVDWKPIAKAWLQNRTQQEVHVLQRAFSKTVEPISHFVLTECKPKIRLQEAGLFQTCLALLSAMLADNIEIGGELHIERLYLFCLMWTFGGLLDEKERKGFNDLLRTLSTALPDDDRDICFFDYYVDESGEWDPWHSKVPETMYSDNQTMLSDITVETVDTIRNRMLMQFASASDQNVLLVGQPGSGKTVLINDFMDTQDAQTQVTKKLVYSGASTAHQLQQFVESNIYHRQGFVYGAKENKKLQLFVDDLNLPNPDEYGVQRCNELMRQLLDDKVMCTLQKPFEWHTVEGLNIFSGVSISDCPSVETRMLSQRFMRHFAVFHLPAAEGETLKTIISGVLEMSMSMDDQPGIDLDMHNVIVNASFEMLSAVQRVLRPTPMPGRRHYMFNLRDFVNCFNCMKRLADESRADEELVVSMWYHETQRLMRDRICRHADLCWFDETLEKTVSEHWPELENSLHKHFITFPIDTRVFQRPVTSLGKKEMRVMLQPVESLREVHTCLQTHLKRYNEEFGNKRLNIMLSDNVLAHLVKMHRVLSYQNCGNFVLVGAVGSHLETLCKLALHVADIPIHHIDTKKQNTFMDGLRSALRMTGAEGKTLTLLFNGRDLREDLYMDAINSVLVCGEYPHLFTNDEMDGLLQALAPAVKREMPNVTVDLKKYFVSRVQANLHIIICLPPSHRLLQIAASQYPGILMGCQLIWMNDWTTEALLAEAAYFVTRLGLTKDCEQDHSEHVVNCLANIHSFVLQDCRQAQWTGDTNSKINLNQVKVNEKKRDQLKSSVVELENRPYSKAILLENIKLRHRHDLAPSSSELFIGPTTYRRFMHTLNELYNLKSKQRTEEVCKLKKVISTLERTRKDAKSMKESIHKIQGEYVEARNQTAGLMKTLTKRSTVLEKLKARVGHATSLSAFLRLNELSDEEEEEDDLLKEEVKDEYDDEFERMREANLRTRQVVAVDEYNDAKSMVEDCRAKLAEQKKQVTFWKNKVDRSCIERLKVFQNPPVLVGFVMEMVMILIGKKSTGDRIEKRDAYPSRDESSGRFSASSGSTKYTTTSKKPKPMVGSVDKFDRQQWKTMQQTMNDSLKFVDILHNVPWEDGIPEDVLLAVESYLAVSPAGKLGVTGEGTLLENAQEKEKTFIPQRRTPSPENSKGITIANARYSSEDAAVLVEYCVAIVEYTRLCGPLKAAQERMQELQREIEENERLQREKENQKDEEEPEVEDEKEEELTDEDMPRIQAEVDDLQSQFDAAVVKKHNMEIELVSMKERLKAATQLVESLREQEKEWRQHVEVFCTNDMVVTNCITASSFLTYCGSMNKDTRHRMGEFFVKICEHNQLPMASKVLFRNMTMVDFLHTETEVRKLELLQLPTSPLMLENATFLMQGDTTMSWPLLSDPTSRVIPWLKQYLATKNLVVVRYTELKSQLDTCLADGLPLLVTDVDVVELAKDIRFHTVIHSRDAFKSDKTSFKIAVGDHEVECQPSFRLYLHTTNMPHTVPPTIAAYVSVQLFEQTRVDVKQELLDRFMRREKARVEDERIALLQEKIENMEKITILETKMVDNLSSNIRLLTDLQPTKHLAELKKHYDETQESQSRLTASIDTFIRARETYEMIAHCAAVCYDVSQHLRAVNPLYSTSFEQFLSLFDTSISHSDRISVKSLVDRMIHSSFTTTIRSLCERDKPLYQLLLALEIEDSKGNVGVGEREYLVAPSYGSIVMTALADNPAANDSRSQEKKPFDWMTDDQFTNLQILAIHYEWFQEMFDRMSKDGRETQWRTLCESDMPEVMMLPDKMDEHYKPLQRLLVIRAVRSDRLMQLSSLFVQKTLGKKYCGEIPVDLPLVLRQSSILTPIVMLYTTEQETAEKLFSEFAQRKQSPTLVVPICGLGQSEERAAKRCLQKGMEEGLWVLLQNAHNSPHLLSSLESLLSDHQGTVDPQFRCWATVQGTSAIPIRTLHTSVKVMVDTPRTMKENLLRAFSWVDADLLKQSNRTEWAPLLHNICYLHGAIRLRARLGRAGWNQPQDFLRIGNVELFEILNMAIYEFRENLSTLSAEGQVISRNTSWTGMRFLLTEVIYGSYVQHPLDQQALNAMVDYWISPNAVKRDFELPKLKYRPPAAFYAGHPRLTQLMQALENLGSHHLEVPEACNLHASSEAVLGEEQYVFTRLNRILDAFPSTGTLTHRLFPRAPTPFDGPAMSNISAPSNSPQIVDHGVFASASVAALRMRKEVELWEICHTMLSKIPKAYSKEYVTERIKKIGSLTSFNLFLMSELEVMGKLLTHVKSTLLAIKAACELTALGDQLTPEQLQCADDLYHLRIPVLWCQLAKDTAPPPNQALSTWLTDLTNRAQHFEKMLLLGREKMPAYWLGAFFNPRGLLALLKQDAYRHHGTDRSGNIEQYVFQTEITARDKDHIRDPPSEGMFIFGAYIWGCTWDKANSELMDAPPRNQCASLPVIHVTCWPQTDKPLLQQEGGSRAGEVYSCPVYQSRLVPHHTPIMELDLWHSGIPAARWALRGLSATVRPY